MKDTFTISKTYFLMMSVSAVILSFVIIGLPLLIALVLRYKFSSLTIDKAAVEYKWGWLNVNYKQIPLDKINNVDVRLGLIGQLFNYGTVKIRTGNDSDTILFIGVDRPQELKKTLESKRG